MARRAALLLLLAAVAVVRAETGCRSYTSKGLIQPAVGTLQDVIVVQDAFVAEHASVALDISHRRIGALRITLGAAPFANAAHASATHPTIVLKSQGLGRRGHNLYGTKFTDTASIAFPVDKSEAPFSGTYRPVQKLDFLIDGDMEVAGSGGSQGLWTLTVSDVAPNNTLREIALNGWTLQLCDTAQAPVPAGSSPPAPVVEGYSGPSEPGSGGYPTQTGPSSILGWQVVYKGGSPAPQQPGAGAGAGSPQTAPVWPPAGGEPLQQLMAQRPLLNLLQSQITAIASGIGGNCDENCQQAKQSMWRAAVFGLYMRAVAEKHGIDRLDWASMLQHVRDWLPGENSKLGALQSWLESHADAMSNLSSWLHDNLKLPAIMVDGQPLQLPLLGGGNGLQQLVAAFSAGGDKVQALLSAFGSAGDRLGQLASHLASSDVAALMAAGKERRRDRVGKVAGKLDSRGEAFQQFMTGLNGMDLGQLAGLNKQGMQDLASNFASMFDFRNL